MRITTDSALLVIDVQKGFAAVPVWGRRNNPHMEAHIAALAAAWTETGRPIVRVRHTSPKPASPLARWSPGHGFAPVAAGLSVALEVDKQVNSAFYGTPDLDAWLRERGIRQLVATGIQTNMCVETTARMGGNLGYDVIVPLDATATFAVAGPDGVEVDAADLTRATAASLHGGGFATVVATSEVLAALRR